MVPNKILNNNLKILLSPYYNAREQIVEQIGPHEAHPSSF